MALLHSRINLSHVFGRSFARLGAVVVVALLTLATGGIGAVAHDPSPTATDSALTTLGYPELRIVVTDEGFTAPQEVASGRYLVVLENQGGPDGSAAVTDINFVQIPEGANIEDLNQAIADEEAPIPEWSGDLVSTGGFSAEAGETGYGVLDLQPGEWYVGAGDTNPFVPLTVTGEAAAAPAAGVDPSADLNVELRDFGFNLPDQLPAGRQVWHATNVGDQSHEMILVKTPELLTVEQVMAVVGLPEGETPPPGVPDPASFEFLSAGLKTMSDGRELWVELDLAPGSYVAICLNVEAETGAPHAMLGMVNVFTVEE